MNAVSRVVIIMPVYNEARHLPDVLGSLSSQTFDRNRTVFIAIDGGSFDGSREIIEAWMQKEHFAGCVLSNPLRKIPISLNLGIRQTCSDDIVLRADAHTVYGETYVADAVSALENAAPDVGCVGAAQRPLRGTTFTQRLIEALYTNPLGLGGADFRTGDDVRQVDSVYLGVWRPGILLRAGGFNEYMEANEDAELAARLRRMGFRILRAPLPCEFIINRGVWASIRQWNRYGYWRAKMLRRHPKSMRARHLLICAGALGTLALACSPLRVLLLPAFGSYAVALFRARAREEPLLVTIATLLYFPALQFAFAVGMLVGFTTGGGALDWPAAMRDSSSAAINP